MKSHKSFSWYLSIILFLNSFLVYSQEGDSLQGIPKIRQLIANQQLNEAKNQLQSQVATLKAQKNWDSLSRYVEFIGSYSLNNNITNLLNTLKRSNIEFTDIETKQSSLEEIFVNFIREN